MTGKEKCEILKKIRREIADKNGIELPIDECDFERECPGFCERCDAEAKMLDEALRKKAEAGEQIHVVGLSQPSFSEAIEKAHEAEKKLLALSIKGLGLSRKINKLLARANIQTVGDLLSLTRSELASKKGIESKNAADIERHLSSIGLHLKQLASDKPSYWEDYLMGVILPSNTDGGFTDF
ncbi:MAG: hypothetical protein IJ012_00020 [Clostridia bacterium]|nr:hypothetical protein [Clostridia bacterium]